MSKHQSPTPSIERQIDALEETLREEGRRYGDLLALARDQGRTMTGADLDAIAGSAAAMASGLSEVDVIRRRREELAGTIMAATGCRANRLTVWLEDQPHDVQARLAPLVADVRLAGQRLMRQNERNRRLASFCLDLVEEEAQVLRRSLLQDPAGCYDRGAQPANEAGGRMLQKKA